MDIKLKKVLLIIVFAFCFSAQADSRFELKSTLYYLPEVIKVADCVMELKEFQSEIRSIKSFSSSGDNGFQVAEKMLSPRKAVVRHYFKLSRLTTAMTVNGEIYINRYKRMNPRSLSKMVNTAMHERFHVLDYGHDGNSYKNNQNSVPYKVGDISEKYVQQCKGK